MYPNSTSIIMWTLYKLLNKYVCVYGSHNTSPTSFQITSLISGTCSLSGQPISECQTWLQDLDFKISTRNKAKPVRKLIRHQLLRPRQHLLWKGRKRGSIQENWISVTIGQWSVYVRRLPTLDFAPDSTAGSISYSVITGFDWLVRTLWVESPRVHLHVVGMLWFMPLT